ncbi:hybrid sensor histidine kinase/response regulator [Sphingobium yanoikuyae]|uniref:hybrid sensor histidine kinase/response regulator n=1 Tax=Sphingobium yanoikuyae TaxID=13690 RepID=UPI0004E3792E|nr:hybrid sensor histidine kinase/response regulator [Sphingobium yanoikuyae]KFD30125.1 histidine kinase [Sphingobium yanoikuyae]MDV3477828.1 PAS domain-containing protein [Sphingobium yanoikuyae]
MINKEHFGSILAAAGASGTWDWDVVADRLSVDAHFAELSGIDPQSADDLPTSSFFLAIHPDDRARIRIAVAGILSGAELFSKEFRVIDPAGVTLWMHARGQCHLDENDQPIRFTGILVDVTERKRTEERLRVAQTAGGVGTFEYVDGYATAVVSDEFCRLLGLHPAPVLPVQTINGVMRGGETLLIPSHREGAIPESLDAEFYIQRNDDGAMRWIARRGEIMREGAGFRLIGVIYDVTAAKEHEAALRELNDTLESRVAQEVANRQQAEDALRQAQKMEAVGQLTGGIAHDFNNLLMAITSSLTLLQKRVPADPHTSRLIENAQQGAERGAALTQRMLAFARRQDLASERIDVSVLVDDVRELIERTLGPAWSLDLQFPDRLPPVLADRNQLELALLNLAVNARDAMPEGGAIRVVAQCRDASEIPSDGLSPGTYVGLSVIDKGIGMDEATLAHATEPFFTTKGVGKGTGLGLSMIHGLAKQLEGGFTLDSTVGHGTTATLWLPAAEEDAAPAALEREVISSFTGRLKILVVDDDFLILMNTAALLEDLGHEVLEASSGEEALALVRQHEDIDLVITDQAMPQMTGTQLADQITDIRGDLPIILASGYGDVPAGSQQRIVRLGKPFGQAMLDQAIAAAMAG